MAEKAFLNADDVSKILERSKSKGYSIIRELNSELKDKGFIVLHGRINARYFFERIYKRKE